MFTATAVARFAGTVETTVGGAAVVKVHTKLAAKEMPALSFAPVVIVAVYKVLLARTTDGVNVAVDAEYVTAPATGVSPGSSQGKRGIAERQRVHRLSKEGGKKCVHRNGGSAGRWDGGDNCWQPGCEAPHKIGSQRIAAWIGGSCRDGGDVHGTGRERDRGCECGCGAGVSYRSGDCCRSWPGKSECC